MTKWHFGDIPMEGEKTFPLPLHSPDRLRLVRALAAWRADHDDHFQVISTDQAIVVRRVAAAARTIRKTTSTTKWPFNSLALGETVLIPKDRVGDTMRWTITKTEERLGMEFKLSRQGANMLVTRVK